MSRVDEHLLERVGQAVLGRSFSRVTPSLAQSEFYEQFTSEERHGQWGQNGVRVTGKGGVQGSRETGQEARGQALQRPGQEIERNKEEDISLKSGASGYNPGSQDLALTGYYSPGSPVRSARQQHTSFRMNGIISLTVWGQGML